MSSESLDSLGRKYGTDKASNGHDYLRHYDFYFRDIRQDMSRIVEIGGLNGASLAMWSDYFPRAQIVCVDIDENVKRFERDRVVVEIGSAGDRHFLKSLVEKYRHAGIIIDDGSHRWDQQRIAFQALFPMVSPGGYYVVEDVHTSYEPNFSGGDEIPFIEILKDRVDFLNLRNRADRERYLSVRSKPAQAIVKAIDSIAFIPRAIVVKKKAPTPPAAR